MSAFGIKSVRAAEDAWVQDEYASVAREEAASPSDTSAPARPPANTPAPPLSAPPLSAPASTASRPFVATGRFARRSVAPAAPVSTHRAPPPSAPAPAPAPVAPAVARSAPPAASAVVAPANPVTAPPVAAPTASAPAKATPASSVPSSHRPSYVAARAAALRSNSGLRDDEDPDDELGVMDENGQLRSALDVHAQGDAGEDSAIALPRLFARQQLAARRMVQELGDVRHLPNDELLALEQRAMRDPLAVVNEYRVAHQNEVRLPHVEGVRSLKEAVEKYPGENVFLLQSGGRQAIRHLPRDGGVNDLLHGLVLDSVPATATPFPNLSELFAGAPVSPAASVDTTPSSAPAVVPSSDVPVATVSSPEVVPAAPTPLATVSLPEVAPVASALVAAPIGASSASVASTSNASPPAVSSHTASSASPQDAASHRWSRKP